MLFHASKNSVGNLGIFSGPAIRVVAISFLLLVLFIDSYGQSDESITSLREHDRPGFLIVIFSPEVDNSRQSSAQSVVWNSFIAKLKKSKVSALEAINEVSVNERADRVRAFELAAAERNKFTLWLQFSALIESPPGSRIEVNSERLVAKYIVFAPGSNIILGQGDIEQERSAESLYQTANNQKAIRDNSGRVTNGRPSVRLPDGSSSNGSRVMDVDTLARVGDLIGDRAIGAVKKHIKAR